VIFSVIVPFKDEADFIAAAARSLLDQDLSADAYEILFVDNDSADGSAQILRGLPPIRVLTEKRPGPYAARNRGLAAASGRIIAFTDADCRVRSDWLRRIGEGMERTGAAIVLGRRRFPAGASLPLRIIESNENIKAQFVINELEPAFLYGYTNNMAVAADLFRRCGGFDEGYPTADTEFIQRALCRLPDTRVAFLPEMLIEHLEVRTLRAWLEKLAFYGRFNAQIEATRPYRHLRQIHRLRILRRQAGGSGHPAAALLPLLLWLGVSKCFYAYGMARGRLAYRKRKRDRG